MGKILIAEEIKLVSLSLQKILHTLGQTELTIIESIDETFDFATKNDIDLLFLSHTLIGGDIAQDSIELLKKIIELYPNLKIIAITNYGEKQTILKFITNGAKTYVEKPLSIENIKNALEELSS